MRQLEAQISAVLLRHLTSNAVLSCVLGHDYLPVRARPLPPIASLNRSERRKYLYGGTSRMGDYHPAWR